MILDTTVLIDLQKESRREQPGAASRLLEASGDALAFITFVTWMEFAEGWGDDDRLACERFLSGFQVLWPDVETAWRAARLSRFLRTSASPSAITICGSPPWRSSTAGRSFPATSGTSEECRGCPSACTESEL